jgi:hypothetical protein
MIAHSYLELYRVIEINVTRLHHAMALLGRFQQNGVVRPAISSVCYPIKDITPIPADSSLIFSGEI